MPFNWQLVLNRLKAQGAKSAELFEYFRLEFFVLLNLKCLKQRI